MGKAVQSVGRDSQAVIAASSHAPDWFGQAPGGHDRESECSCDLDMNLDLNFL
jgi:hypothetical protein